MARCLSKPNSFYLIKSRIHETQAQLLVFLHFSLLLLPKKLVEKWPICFSFSKLCERKIFPPSFRVPFWSVLRVTDHCGQEGKHFVKAETTKIGEIVRKEWKNRTKLRRDYLESCSIKDQLYLFNYSTIWISTLWWAKTKKRWIELGEDFPAICFPTLC